MEEVNLGGRPPIYEPTEENFEIVKNLCDTYFEYIKGDYSTEEVEYEERKFKDVTICNRNPEPPTVTGLTLHLSLK